MDYFMVATNSIIRVFDVQDEGEYKTARLAHHFGKNTLTVDENYRVIYPSNFINNVAFKSIDDAFLDVLISEWQTTALLLTMDIVINTPRTMCKRIIKLMEEYYAKSGAALSTLDA